MTKRIVLIVLLIIPGIAVAAVCLNYAWRDLGKLHEAYGAYRAAISQGADLRALFIADSAQRLLRINVFAEGVWALLGFLIAALGVHGLCTMRPEH